MYYISDVCMEGNEHEQLRANTIYACLYNDDGDLIISSTLQHILESIRDRNLKVFGVDVEWSQKRETLCSTVEVNFIKPKGK